MVLTELSKQMVEVSGSPSWRYGPTVAVPFRSQDSVIGVLVVLRLAGAPTFEPGEVPLLTSFAEQAALALELGEKNRAQRQLDVFADRDRIARDLHDHVIQRLFATGLQLQSTLRRIADPGAQAGCSRPWRISTPRSARSAPPSSTCTPRASRPRWACGARCWTRRPRRWPAPASCPPYGFDGAVDTLVPDDVGAHAVAVVREAISNAVRHGRATSVTLTVEAGAELVIDVLDDGVGIEPGPGPQRAAQPRGAGRVRAAERCPCGAEPASGTRLVWRVPLG